MLHIMMNKYNLSRAKKGRLEQERQVQRLNRAGEREQDISNFFFSFIIT